MLRLLASLMQHAAQTPWYRYEAKQFSPSSSTLRCVHADYGFEYSEDDEPEEDEQIETENTYYGAKGCISCMHTSHTFPQLYVALKLQDVFLSPAALEGENYQEALEGFEKVVALENSDKGEWCACVQSQIAIPQPAICSVTS
jgi:hypothetical protein